MCRVGTLKGTWLSLGERGHHHLCHLCAASLPSNANRTCYYCSHAGRVKSIRTLLPLTDICDTAERRIILSPGARAPLHSGLSQLLKGGVMAHWARGDVLTAVSVGTIDCAGTKLQTLSWLKERSCHFSGWLTANRLNREWHCLSTIVNARVPPAAGLYFRLRKSWKYYRHCRGCIGTFLLVFLPPQHQVRHNER